MVLKLSGGAIIGSVKGIIGVQPELRQVLWLPHYYVKVEFEIQARSVN